MTQKTLQQRVLDLEAWVESFKPRVTDRELPAQGQDFSTEGSRTGRWTASGNSKQRPVEEVLTEESAQARFGKTILELANEQLRSDSDHWAQKAHTYRDQLGEFNAQVKELRDKNFEQFTLMRQYNDKKEKALADLEELQNELTRYKKRSTEVSEGYRKAMLGEQSEKWALKAKFDALSANCTHLRMGETRKQISELEVEGNSLRYQNKQGNKIRDELHERINKLDEILDRQSQTIIKQDETIDAKIAQVDERGVHLDNADSVIEKQIREISDRDKRTDAQFNLIQQLRGTVAGLRDATIRPAREVFILMYKYKTHHQEQLCGVFSSQEEVDLWLEDNPAARDEETVVYPYTIDKGEL
jgi:chromosome segregation ATPase